MILLDIVVRVVLYGAGILCLFVLIVAAFAPRAAALTDDDTHGLDLLDQPEPQDDWMPRDYYEAVQVGWPMGDPDDPCATWPWECHLIDESPGMDPWAPTIRYCATHQRTLR